MTFIDLSIQSNLSDKIKNTQKTKESKSNISLKIWLY